MPNLAGDGPDQTPILENATITITAIDATGNLRYYVRGITGTDLNCANNAAQAVPYQIGDKYPVQCNGGKSASTNVGATRTKHTMRVFSLTPSCVQTNNSTKWMVDVGLRSPPTVQEFSGSALLQEKNEFFLTGKDTDSPPNYKQIQLRYAFAPVSPLLSPPQPPVPCSVNKYFYTETFSISATFYQDEIKYNTLQGWKAKYTSKLNNNQFRDVSPDLRMWLCTGVEIPTNDNGMSFRVTASFTKNPLTWDPIVTQRNTQTGQPLLLSQSDLNKASQFLVASIAGNIPNPSVPVPPPVFGAGGPQGGIGRFPIYQAADLNEFIEILRGQGEGTLPVGATSGDTQNDIPNFPTIPQYRIT